MSDQIRDTLYECLLANVANWADALDPADPYADDEPMTPALRLAKLAKDASGPFPLLVVAHRETSVDRYGDVCQEGFFETRRFDDAPSLIDGLAELEVKHGIDDRGQTTVEIHRLALRNRLVESWGLCEDLTSAEEDALSERVKIKVAEMTENKRRADEIASQARRAADAERTRKRELAKLAELKAKYENARSSLV